MGGIHCYTSVSFAYFQRARVLAETINRHHPDWTLWICVSDREPPGFTLDLSKEAFDHVIWTENLPIEGIDGWIFKHNVVELCTAVKGYVLNTILAAGADAVIYIDPDIALFTPLDPVLEALETHSIVLTPHLVEPENTRSAVWENERSALMHGVYNLGFLAVKSGPEGRRFGRWWQDRLAEFSYEEAQKGIYTDQRWCDLVPAFFEEVKILRDPGHNVASWNLNTRPMTIDREGRILIAGFPLRFYHFTKIDAVGELMIERYAGTSAVAFELIAWYRNAMQRNSCSEIPSGWWSFGYYSDGTPIDQVDRVLYRSRPDLMEVFPNPFAAETYLAWLRAEGGGAS